MTGSEPNPSLCKALFEHGMLGNGKVVQFLCFSASIRVIFVKSAGFAQFQG